MQTAFKKVWIVGAGSVGSVLAAVLAIEDRIRVCLVGQSPQAEAVRKKGLTFQAGEEIFAAIPIEVNHPQQLPVLGEQDLVLLTLKAYAFQQAALWLKARCSRRTAIIALQNGIGPEQVLEEQLGRPVDRGLAFFGANSQEPGRIQYFPGRLQLRRSVATEAFAALMAGSRLPCEINEDFKKSEWQKLAINSVANSLAGILKIGNRRIIDPTLEPAKREILAEVCRVALAEGVELKTTTVDINRILNQDNVPSLRIDLERGLQTEIDFLNGAVVRLGQKHDIKTPVNAILVAMVKFLEKSEQSTPER